MELLMIVVSVVQSIAISLGVGASTLAIVNFFVAIADGEISLDERKMMGVVYAILRIAMGAILTTSFILFLLHYMRQAPYLTVITTAQWTLIGMLFLNAFLMTKHLISSKLGPAIQASTWYTLGIVSALFSLNVQVFSYWQFLVGYAVAMVCAIAVVNLYMKQVTPKKNG